MPQQTECTDLKMDIDHPLLDWLHDQIYAVLVEHGDEVRAGMDPTGAEIAAIKKTQALCAQLQRDLGGRDHYLPALGKDRRQRDILQDLQAGLSPADVASKHKMHPKTVAKVAAKARQASHDNPGLGTKEWMID